MTQHRPVLAALLLFGLAFVGTDRVLSQRTQPGSRDLDLHAAVATRVAGGEPYYDVLAEELPGRGYPVRPPFAWRLPTLTWLLAVLGTRTAGHVVLWSIGALSVLAWARVLKLRAGAAALVLILPLWLAFSPLAVYMHELWAGQLIALGLALWLADRQRAALVALVCAAVIREHAALALAIVAIDAWHQGRSPRRWGWALAVVAGAFTAHLAAVVWHTPADGITNGWGGLLGWAFFVSAIQSHVLLVTPPYWVAAAAAAVCVPALWTWRQGRVVAIVVTAYAAIFCTVARPDNWYWGLLIVPLVPLGCVALIGPRRGRASERAGEAMVAVAADRPSPHAERGKEVVS